MECVNKIYEYIVTEYRHVCSGTRLGDLLDFGQLSKPVATISLPKCLTFLGNFSKGVKILNFSSKIIFGQLLQTFGNFLQVTLHVCVKERKGKSERESERKRMECVRER